MKKYFFLFIIILLFFMLSINSFAAVKKIDGTMYSIDENNNITGEYNGFTKSKITGERFYYEKGKRVYGWQQIKDNWYYFKNDGSAATGNYAICDIDYEFFESGIWKTVEISGLQVYNFICSYVNPDDHAYGYINDGIMSICVINKNNVLNSIKNFYPLELDNIEFIKVKYSKKQLDKAVSDIIDKNENNILLSAGIEPRLNKVIVNVEKIDDKITELINRIDNNDCIEIHDGFKPEELA